MRYEGCCLVVTTAAPALPRRMSPEATAAIADKIMPGFGEQMRAVSLKYVPTADPLAPTRRDPR